MRAVAIIASLLFVGLGLGGLGIAAVWGAANGLTSATFTLMAFAGGAFAAARALAFVPRRRVFTVLALIALALDAVWSVQRWARPLPPAAYDVCFAGACAQPRVTLGRLVPELESVRAGLWLTRWVGITRADEAESYSAAARGGPDGLPNPAFEFSRPSALTVYRYRGSPNPRRCIVFLHGFGGLLTAYLEVMAQSGLGKDALVLAPVLDPVGAWSSTRGAGVVEATLAQAAAEGLPRCWLIGLSNGAVAAWHLPARPSIREHLVGAVLVSGLGEVASDRSLPAVPTLVLSGTRDARFDWRWIEAAVVERERDLGAGRLEHLGLPADHFLILSAAEAWTAVARSFVERVEALPP